MNKGYFVVREYSGHTARKVLWQVLSRPFEDKGDAENWLHWCEHGDPDTKHLPGEFFLVNNFARDDEE